MNVCVCVCVCICMCVYVCMYVCMYVCNTHICIMRVSILREERGILKFTT